MKINFNQLKNAIRKTSGVVRIEHYKNTPADFFNSKGELMYLGVFGEFWKNNDVLMLNFRTDTNHEILLKTSKINWISFKDNEEDKKRIFNIYLNNLEVLNTDLKFKENILEYTFENSSKNNPVPFLDTTIFLVDKYELYLRFVFETHHLFVDYDQEYEFAGSLFVYAEELEIVYTNIDLKMFDDSDDFKHP